MMLMSVNEFKEMCRQLKVFPVVVSEETVDKVTLFCAAKRNGVAAMGKAINEETNAMATLHDSNLSGGNNVVQGSFEFGDFIRAFKVSISINRCVVLILFLVY